ncbi:unnamed protein product [Cochlearia groenlandica]
MLSEYCKEREVFLSPPHTSWWNAFGSPPLTTESLAVYSSDSFAGVKVATMETEQVVNKQSSETIFTFSHGGGISSKDESKPNVAFALHSSCLEFGFSQPSIHTKHPYIDQQHYGVVAAYGPRISSGRVMLPLNMEAEEHGTVYVNSKQYYGIIRRRQSRAKAVLKNKLSKCRKPYMHHSRHLHAMRRPRGSGGRFLNTKKAVAPKQSNSSNSEDFHQENRTINSSKETNKLHVYEPEATRMDYFLSSSVHSIGGMVMPIGSYNLKT